MSHYLNTATHGYIHSILYYVPAKTSPTIRCIQTILQSTFMSVEKIQFTGRVPEVQQCLVDPKREVIVHSQLVDMDGFQWCLPTRITQNRLGPPCSDSGFGVLAAGLLLGFHLDIFPLLQYQIYMYLKWESGSIHAFA